MKALPIQFDESIPAWEKAIYAFLAEKERRSGSMRTVDAYTRTLQRFFGTLGKTPEQITPPDVVGFAHGIGPSGREPAVITIGARLACISSFYRFLYVATRLATMFAARTDSMTDTGDTSGGR
jgi:Phage integrase, N-terminal SAM-like domain.